MKKLVKITNIGCIMLFMHDGLTTWRMDLLKSPSSFLKKVAETEWKDSQGNKHKLQNMSQNHLLNTLEMCEKRAARTENLGISPEIYDGKPFNEWVNLITAMLMYDEIHIIDTKISQLIDKISACMDVHAEATADENFGIAKKAKADIDKLSAEVMMHGEAAANLLEKLGKKLGYNPSNEMMAEMESLVTNAEQDFKTAVGLTEKEEIFTSIDASKVVSQICEALAKKDLKAAIAITDKFVEDTLTANGVERDGLAWHLNSMLMYTQIEQLVKQEQIEK
jgi:hypothetical protein